MQDDQTADDSDFVSSVSLRHLSRELKYNYYDCYTQHEGGMEKMDGHAKVIIKYLADQIFPGKIIEAGINFFVRIENRVKSQNY